MLDSPHDEESKQAQNKLDDSMNSEEFNVLKEAANERKTMLNNKVRIYKKAEL